MGVWCGLFLGVGMLEGFGWCLGCMGARKVLLVSVVGVVGGVGTVGFGVGLVAHVVLVMGMCRAWLGVLGCVLGWWIGWRDPGYGLLWALLCDHVKVIGVMVQHRVWWGWGW